MRHANIMKRVFANGIIFVKNMIYQGRLRVKYKRNIFEQVQRQAGRHFSMPGKLFSGISSIFYILGSKYDEVEFAIRPFGSTR